MKIIKKHYKNNYLHLQTIQIYWKRIWNKYRSFPDNINRDCHGKKLIAEKRSRKGNKEVL